MRLRQRLLTSAATGVLILGGLAIGTAPASGQALPLVIGVDNATPSPCGSAHALQLSPAPTACHNFEYLDFFPNGLGSTSGVIAAAFPGAPNSTTFSFPNGGTFNYQCRVHDHMFGQVSAAAVVAPALPKAGAVPSGAVAKSTTPLPIAAFLIAILALAGMAVRGTRKVG